MNGNSHDGRHEGNGRAGRMLVTLQHVAREGVARIRAARMRERLVAGGQHPTVRLTLRGPAARGADTPWRLELSSNPSSVGLWAWGLRINGVNVAVETPTLQDVALRFEGAHPVRGTGRLAFDLPTVARVDLALFDVQGRRILSLLEGRQQPGAFRMNFSTASLQPGLYFARLLIDGETRGQVRVSIVR